MSSNNDGKDGNPSEGVCGPMIRVEATFQAVNGDPQGLPAVLGECEPCEMNPLQCVEVEFRELKRGEAEERTDDRRYPTGEHD